MNLSKILRNNIFENKFKFYLITFLLGILLRSIIAIYYGDTEIENEWKVLVYNLYKFNSFSMLEFDNLFVPNLWMPPIYGYFIYLHALIFGLEEKLAASVIVSQIIISSFTPIIFFKILLNFFKKEISILGAFVFCVFPIIVFSASQISSVTIYIFLFLTFVLLFLQFANKPSNFLSVSIGLISGILILTRRDFILIYFFSLLYFLIFLRVDLKKIITMIFVFVITISPYLIRNYISFERIILHSGFGYNVWKAYNPKADVEGFYVEEEELKLKINKVEKNIFYRINEDKIYLNEAKKYIMEEPFRYFKLFLKRIYSFYFFDFNSTQKNYYNLFHIAPNTIVSILSIFGLIICTKKNVKLNYMILTFFLIVFIYSSFAVLPRYKIYIIPFQIIFSLVFLEFLLKKLIKKN